jgi:hypothetical protein
VCGKTLRQAHLALQRDALAEAGAQKIFTEQMSGAVLIVTPGARLLQMHAGA